MLPEFLSVYSDPTSESSGQTELAGYYKFDNEGVKAETVTVVENGVLKNFLMSRLPVDGFPDSNGHGRRAPGRNVAGRQSNLLVTASNTVTPEELKNHAHRRSQEAAICPTDCTSRRSRAVSPPSAAACPNFFEVIPTMVYRIYPDGQEELVRGVDLIGTALTAFNKILAADNRMAGVQRHLRRGIRPVPVSAGGPGLLFSEVEVQKKPKSQELSPILAPPFDDKGGNYEARTSPPIPAARLCAAPLRRPTTWSCAPCATSWPAR